QGYSLITIKLLIYKNIIVKKSPAKPLPKNYNRHIGVLATHKGHGYNSVIGCRNAPEEVHRSAVLISHRCLLHPPPLVDLARSRKASGFFLPFSGVRRTA